MSEKLKFHSIAAGPDFQAQPGEVVIIDNSKMAKALKEGHYAEPFKGTSRISPAEPPAPATDTSIPALTAAEIDALKTPDKITAALAGLDPNDDEIWTANGKPAMAAIEAILGTKAVSRAEVDAAAPDFRRPLRTDGPTVAEYVKAGYPAKNYPPAGWESKSTAEEIADAIKAQETAEVENPDQGTGGGTDNAGGTGGTGGGGRARSNL